MEATRGPRSQAWPGLRVLKRNSPLLAVMTTPAPFPPQETKQEDGERLVLESNPLEWTVTDVVRFIKLTDCAPLAKIFQEQVGCFLGGLAAVLMRLWISVKPSAQQAFCGMALAGRGVPPHYFCG